MNIIDIEKYLNNERFEFTGCKYVTGRPVIITAGEEVTDRNGNKGRMLKILLCSKKVKEIDIESTNMEALKYFVYIDIAGCKKSYQCNMLSEFTCKGITEDAKKWLYSDDEELVCKYY